MQCNRLSSEVSVWCTVCHKIIVCVYAFSSDIALKECPAYEETKVQVYEEVDAVRPRDENPYDN